MRSGNYLILAHDGHGHTDYLLEVDREGEVVWDWWFETVCVTRWSDL